MQKKETRGRKKDSKTLSPLQKYQKYSGNGHINYSFNYLIHAIDQKMILKNGWDLDIIDMAIFFQIKNFIDSGKAEKVTDMYGDWFFISENKTIKDLPCVPINSKNAVYKRVQKLVQVGLIQRNPTNKLTGKKYIRVVPEVYELYCRDSVEK